MKVEVKENEKQNDIIYPCLMKGDLTEAVVLFSERGKGIYLESGTSYCPAGLFYSYFNMAHFKPFTGSITLSNE